jgi:lipoprotein-releasing system ATP-binding protein
MNRPAEPIVTATGIYKSYHKETLEVPVLQDLSFSVNRGEFIMLKGPSGAGKSTLLNLIGALDKPSRGELRVNGMELNTMNEKKQADFRNAFVGFVFQFHHLLAEFTALENVLIPALINSDSEKNRDRAAGLLDKVGLAERATHKPSELSGGEQQRVAIARALMNEPKLVLADEPTGNLDSKTSQKVFDLLYDLNRNENYTFIIATHNEQFAQMADRILEIKDGRLLS